MKPPPFMNRWPEPEEICGFLIICVAVVFIGAVIVGALGALTGNLK